MEPLSNNARKKLARKHKKANKKVLARTGICKLCHVHCTTLCNSHVIPKMYRDIIIRTCPDNDKHFLCVTKNGIKREYDLVKKYALCATCEGKLKHHEDYAETFFKRGLFENCTSIEQTIPDKPILVYNGNFNYSKFKLFIMSIIWRTDMFMFSNRLLGPIHADRIRQLLLSNDPGDDNMYEIYVFHTQLTDVQENSQKAHVDWITYPVIRRWPDNGMYFASFVIETWEFYMMIHSRKDYRPHCLKPYRIGQKFQYIRNTKTILDFQRFISRSYFPKQALQDIAKFE